MDKRTITGFALIAALMIGWYWFSMPSQKQIEREKFVRDSLNRVQFIKDSTDKAQAAIQQSQATPQSLNDTTAMKLLKGKMGAFAAASVGRDSLVYIENDLLKIAFSLKGGAIKGATLKKFQKYVHSDTLKNKDQKEPMVLLGDNKNAFEYSIPVNYGDGYIKTSSLYFSIVESTPKSVTLRAQASPGRYIEQKYNLSDGSYFMDYDLGLQGLDSVIAPSAGDFRLDWNDFMVKAEKNDAYENTMTTVYYNKVSGGTTHCSCTGKDDMTYDKPVKWVSHVQQFFNATLIASDKPFNKVNAKTEILNNQNNPDNNLKLVMSTVYFPIQNKASETYKMKFLLGPNDYEVLASANVGLPKIIPYGWSVFGAINRYVVRPLFNLLSSFIPSMGLCIILLTLIVKLLMYPLQYKMILSSVKMNVLKPKMADLKKKYGDDQQKFAAEQMKIYQSYGVNPLGGCLPSLIQTPIWIALYRFFPSSLPFRGESFLWANDLVSYDDLIKVGGMHISLFTLLWLISMLWFAWYNSKLMDTTMTQNNPVMKYLPYIFPFIFFFVLNSSAAGLTCYMLFSNLFNIGLTFLIKEVIIDKDKVSAKLEFNKANPKPKSKFAERLEQAMKQSEEIRKQQEAKKKGGK